MRDRSTLPRYSIHFRFGDGPDGRRQIGSTPAGGDAESADTSRESAQASARNGAGRDPPAPIGDHYHIDVAGQKLGGCHEGPTCTIHRDHLPPHRLALLVALKGS